MKNLRTILVVVLGLFLAGCATQVVQERQEIERKIANAQTRADHETLAAWFEQQASQARERAEDHRRMGEHYERWAYMQPLYLGRKPFPDVNGSAGFLQRCESLVHLNEQAAEESLALARLHREIAASSEAR